MSDGEPGFMCGWCISTDLEHIGGGWSEEGDYVTLECRECGMSYDFPIEESKGDLDDSDEQTALDDEIDRSTDPISI